MFWEKAWKSVELPTNCSQPNSWMQKLQRETAPVDDEETDIQESRLSVTGKLFEETIVMCDRTHWKNKNTVK